MNKICDLFEIQYPIIQGGMIWSSGWELASAVSNAGGLGLIGSGSMYPDVLRDHIRKCKAATANPFGVNIPLIYPQVNDHIQVLLDEKIKIVFTSAGNPKKYTEIFHENGIKVAHVIAASKFAVKCEEAGVDAIVAEGFEAGGHNGPDETTTMALIPAVSAVTSRPLIAAGGIASGRGMAAAMALGAQGVQIGSRFAASIEASGHPDFKQSILDSNEGDTQLVLKKLIPVRLIKNKFFKDVKSLEEEGGSREKLMDLLGRGRAKMGMFKGDLDEGELEIGQVSALISEIKPAQQIVEEIISEFNQAAEELGSMKF